MRYRKDLLEGEGLPKTLLGLATWHMWMSARYPDMGVVPASVYLMNLVP